MPLDSEGYLVSQGWAGRGTALRQGSLIRPLAIPQKKTLAGLGKDRDEAFPFWDHLFSAAAKSIQLKCIDSDDEESGSDPSSSSGANLKRTSTGIISNRRPVTGTPADSGSNTPDPHTPRLSLMAAAKRDAARRGLYSRFFKGPILGPESVAEEEKRLERILEEAMKVDPGVGGRVRVKEHVEIEMGGGRVVVDLEVEKEVGMKRKRKRKDGEGDGEDRDVGKAERKAKRAERRREKEERRERRKSRLKVVEEEEVAEAATLSREEKKQLKREKKRRREEETTTNLKEKPSSKKSKKSKHQVQELSQASATVDNIKNSDESDSS